MNASLRATLPHVVCTKRFLNPRSLRMIREIIASDPQQSRAEIARHVCEQLDWHDIQGKPKLMGAAVTLLRFHRKGWIPLPEPRNRGRTSGTSQAALPGSFCAPEHPLESSLRQLGPITLKAVSIPADSGLWNGLIARYHYQGYQPLCGAQIRYLIHGAATVLGAISFSAAALALRDRDQWIGWDRHQRQRNRHLIVNNSRFLLLPWVRVPNLASHVLAKAARQVPADFQQRYGYPPVLLETFVEQERFQGTCYRAANWLCVGQTQGLGRDLHALKPAQKLPIKSIWLYPLRTGAREQLCQRPAPTAPAAA